MQSEPRRYRHKKRGTTYQVLHTGRLQVDGDLDNERVTVYRCEQDGGIWVRPDYEFNDGRFEELPSLASPSPISADAVVEACAKVAENHTPYKRQGTLAAHVTGTAISRAIRALKGTFPAVDGSADIRLYQRVIDEMARIMGDLQAELDKGKTP